MHAHRRSETVDDSVEGAEVAPEAFDHLLLDRVGEGVAVDRGRLQTALGRRLRHRDGVVEAGASGFFLRGRPFVENGERRHAMSKRRRDPGGEPIARGTAQDEGVTAGAGPRSGGFCQPDLLVHRRRASRGMGVGTDKAPDPRSHNLERHSGSPVPDSNGLLPALPC